MTDEQTSWRPSAALNPERLDFLWGFAGRIATATIVPETLRGTRAGYGASSTFEEFEPEVIHANVFAVVEQADRWNISPFALLAAASIVRGKLTFEGKVIAAVMESQFGIKLQAYYRGNPGTDDYRVYLCDKPLPDDVLAALKPGYRHDDYMIMDGSVGEWKTTGNGSPWRPATYADMLIYRGSRQWSRVYQAGAILGVLADDEIETVALEHAAQNAVPIGQRFAAPDAARQGFAADNVTRALEHNPQQPMETIQDKTAETVETKSEAQSGTTAETTSSGPQGGTAPASAKPSADADGGARAPTPAGAGPQGTPSSSAAPDENGQGGDMFRADAPVQRVSAELWRGYHSALARMTKPESIQKAHDTFWDGNGIKVSHPDDIQLGKDIKTNHLDRAAGKIEGAVLAKEVEGWILQVTGATA